MLNKDNLNRIQGILKAQAGSGIPFKPKKYTSVGRVGGKYIGVDESGNTEEIDENTYYLNRSSLYTPLWQDYPYIQTPKELKDLQELIKPISTEEITETSEPKLDLELITPNIIENDLLPIYPTPKEVKKPFLETLGDTPGERIGAIGTSIGKGIDLLQDTLVDNLKFAEDSFTNSKGRLVYDAVSDSLMAFSPIGTIAGGAMKTFGLINDLAGKKPNSFSADLKMLNQIGGSYGGSASTINEAASKAGQKYGLFEWRKRRKANKLIAEASQQLYLMQDIAKDAKDSLMASTIMSDVNNLNYLYQMNGGFDLRYMRVAKSGARILYFKPAFKPILNDINLEPKTTSILKSGGTIENLLKSSEFKVVLSNPTESFKKGGTIKDREIEVIETNTTQKSVIPEGALHKNKHHLDLMGVDDSELTKKGIPVVDNDGDLLAEIELNEIIFTLEVTKELESRYREFYKEETPNSKKDELAIEAGKLLWKEILYNTDDRTGLIDTLKQGGTLKAQEGIQVPDALYVQKPKIISQNSRKVLPEFKTYLDLLNYLKLTGRDSDEDYDLEAAFNDPEVYRIWRVEELKNPGKGHWTDKYKKPNHPTFSTESVYSNDKTKGGQWIEFEDGTYQFIVSPYLMSKYSFEDYLKYFENEPGNTVIYGKKRYTSKPKHSLGGIITLEDINLMVKNALLNMLNLN